MPYGHPHRKARRALPPPQGDPCPFCRQPMWPDQQLDADHVVPLMYGGDNSPLRWAHAHCNRSAGATTGNRRRNRRRW